MPLPWRPPAASPLEGRLAAWADGARWPDGGALGVVRWRGVTTEDAAAVAARIGEPSSVALAIMAGDGARWSALAVVPWSLAIAIVRATLAVGDGVELMTPRPPTVVERALVAAAVADALARAGIVAEVGLARPTAPPAASAIVRLAVARPHPAEIVVVVPAAPAPRLRSVHELLARRGSRLPPVAATVELARGALPAAAAARLAALALGDVIVVGPRAAAVRIARGRVAGALDLAAGRLTVGAAYLRTDPTAMSPHPDDLADDLSIPLAVVAGEVWLSARALLELAPGAVLALGRPLAGVVELWAGGRRIARGELVEVEGALGVRIAELLDESPRTDAAGVGPLPAATNPSRGD